MKRPWASDMNAGLVKPHLVFVLADDFGWNNWQHQNPELISPTLVALAQEGVLLERHYVYVATTAQTLHRHSLC